MSNFEVKQTIYIYFKALGVIIATGVRSLKISRTDRFRYRTRYFTDAGIIGSKAFVGEIFNQFKHLLKSKDERTFKPVGGIEGGLFHEKAGGLSVHLSNEPM